MHVQVHNQERRFNCDICSQNFRLKHHLTGHRKRHTTNGDQERKFTCDICSESFKLKQILTAHLKMHRTKAEKEKYRCKICEKQFSQCNLDAHLKYHSGNRPFACQQCEKRFVHKGDLGRHMKMHERQKNKNENENSNNETNIQEIFIDVNVNENENENVKDEPMSEPYSEHDDSSNFDPTYLKFESEIGFGQVSDNSIDVTHIKVEKTECVDESKENDQNNWNNEEADGVVPSIEPKREMENLQKSDPPKHTPTKSKSKSKTKSESKSTLSQATKREEANSERTFICDVCEKSFRLKHHLGVHLRTHFNIKNYQCEICSKQFKQGSHLTLHKRVHTGERKYPCSICGKRFIHSSDMRRHLQTHREQFPFLCSGCLRRFADQDAKELHENSCTVKLLTCQTCDYKTSISSRFRTHVKSHLAREFSCEICTQSFIYKQNLENHLRTHTNERYVEIETDANMKNVHPAQKTRCILSTPFFSNHISFVSFILGHFSAKLA